MNTSDRREVPAVDPPWCAALCDCGAGFRGHACPPPAFCECCGEMKPASHCRPATDPFGGVFYVCADPPRRAPAPILPLVQGRMTVRGDLCPPLRPRPWRRPEHGTLAQRVEASALAPSLLATTANVYAARRRTAGKLQAMRLQAEVSGLMAMAGVASDGRCESCGRKASLTLVTVVKMSGEYQALQCSACVHAQEGWLP